MGSLRGHVQQPKTNSIQFKTNKLKQDTRIQVLIIAFRTKADC